MAIDIQENVKCNMYWKDGKQASNQNIKSHTGDTTTDGASHRFSQRKVLESWRFAVRLTWLRSSNGLGPRV